jgi:hypothetical protein
MRPRGKSGDLFHRPVAKRAVDLSKLVILVFAHSRRLIRTVRRHTTDPRPTQYGRPGVGRWFGESAARRSLAHSHPGTCPRLLCQSGWLQDLLSATFLTHRTTSSPSTLFRPPGSRAILILARERNLQKFSSLCQAQYRKPTGGFFAAFTQSGSTASVSASMASSCGRYQMTAAMLTNKHALRSSISGVSDRLPAVRAALLQYSSQKTRDWSNVTQRGQFL